MGYFSKGVCWPTNAEAKNAYFSDAQPHQLITSTSTIENIYVSSGDVWYLQQFTTSNGVRSSNFAVLLSDVSFPSCVEPNDPATQFSDGMTLGWGVGLAMIAAWGLSYLAKRQLGTRL